MKRRVAPILTFTIALILVSGLAYAAKKKVNTRPSVRTPDPTHEEEALEAELLDATEELRKALPNIDKTNPKEIISASEDEKIKDKIITKQPKK